MDSPTNTLFIVDRLKSINRSHFVGICLHVVQLLPFVVVYFEVQGAMSKVRCEMWSLSIVNGSVERERERESGVKIALIAALPF